MQLGGVGVPFRWQPGMQHQPGPLPVQHGTVAQPLQQGAAVGRLQDHFQGVLAVRRHEAFRHRQEMQVVVA